jgi:iron complex outermembrane receptor protein
VDNSALPTAKLNPASPTFTGFDFLYYDSEEAEGFETGIKANLLENSLRINATAFYYEYSDLQVQLFNSIIIQFETFNASELVTQGIETDMLWLTPIDGLSLRGNLALTNTEFEDDFFNANGQNLKGEDAAGNADLAGTIGFSYDRDVSRNWRIDVSSDARYNSGYNWTTTLDPFEQDDFWLLDASVRLYSADQRYELALIARNLTDEVYAFGGGARPGACADNQALVPFGCNTNIGPNEQDQVTYTSFGRLVTAQFRVRF